MKLKDLNQKFIDTQWDIVEELAVLLKNYSLKQIQEISDIENNTLRYLASLTPLLKYRNDLPPQFAYELLPFLKNKGGKQKINKYIKFYKKNKNNIKITPYRQYIRNDNIEYKRDTTYIPNSKFNKQLYFLKRKLYTTTQEQQQAIINELKQK